MARKVVLETAYVFTPATRTLVIPKLIQRERLLLITNVTANKVIYNFSDPSLSATSYTLTTGVNETTTLVLSYNTTAMSATDKIQITFDDYNETFEPGDTQMDPTNKLRVTTPQALIDTDFEYGTQISKWENLGMVNNRAFAYQSYAPIANITSIGLPNGSRTVTVTTSAAHGLSVGTPIVVQDTYLSLANGNYIIESVTTSSPHTFVYTSRAVNTTSITDIFDPNKTAIYNGTLYASAQIGSAPANMTYSGNIVTVTTSVPHGLSLGNEVAITGVTASTSNPPNGSWYVSTITNSTTFSYYVLNAPVGTLGFGSAAVYPLPQAQFLHRSFDGGVLFSSNGNSNNEQAIRQTRRYFRYQSGKGIQMSSGTILRPYTSVDSLTSSGTTVTVQTKERHNIQPGTIILITNANESAYNGQFTVNSVTGYNTFTYVANSIPASSPASGIFSLSVVSWYGAQARLGIFDQQNGLFFEYDGQQLYAVRRNSVTQLSGKVTVTNGSNTITQTNSSFPTYFAKQVHVGDFVVIRGQSYRITDVASDTSMTISPSYRAATAQFAVISKTQELRIPQSQWNMDKMDGTGPSGYTIDLSKMQMFYIDYTWYGAGFVRWGMRGPRGNVVYVHRMLNNNINTEAYMRSGNLPARYETNTTPPTTWTAATLNSSDTTLTVADTSAFPPSGTVVVRNAAAYEYMNYTAKTATTFTGLTRGQAGNSSLALTVSSGSNVATVASTSGLQVGQRVWGANVPEGAFIATISGSTITLSQAVTAANPTVVVTPMGLGSAQTFTFSTTADVAVELAYPTFAPSISHWGTSVIMDGGYDDDKSLLFTYGQTAQTLLADSAQAAAISGVTATGTSGQFTITATGTVTNVVTGMTVSGTGIGAGAVVTSRVGQVLTLSVANSGTVSGTMTFGTGTSNTKALFSIRVAPSADNGVAAGFGQRELINRMQLILRELGVSLASASSNVLVQAVLNGVPSTSTAWTNAVGNVVGRVNSSLAQIADYAGGITQVNGGEVTGGFLVNGTSTVDLAVVRDLGNAVLGGGGANANTNIYPDGPDVLTITVTNVGTGTAQVLGRLSWTEAQA
jgi:hypothetical protein